VGSLKVLVNGQIFLELGEEAKNGVRDYGHEFSQALNPSCGETLLALQDKCATQRKLQEVSSFFYNFIGCHTFLQC
jgi:hypothetical protein